MAKPQDYGLDTSPPRPLGFARVAKGRAKRLRGSRLRPLPNLPLHEARNKDSPMPFALSADREREMTEILARYPTRRAATIPLLHLCQDQDGYVSEESMVFVADKVGTSAAQVKGVVTF